MLPAIYTVQRAENILAVNWDADAPIMQMADYVVCADIFEAIPRLIQIAEELRGPVKI